MLPNRNTFLASLRRETWLEINLNSFQKNLYTIKSKLANNNCEIMPVLKADGYGHGAQNLIGIISAMGIKQVAVASVDEALGLRKIDKNIKILILSPIPNWCLNTVCNNNIDITITSQEQLNNIIETSKELNFQVQIHIKIDSGMARLGVNKHEFDQVINTLSNNPHIKLNSIFSHLAKAYDNNSNKLQYDYFMNCINNHNFDKNIKLHIASSSAIWTSEYTHLDIVRPGLAIYGLESTTISNELIPILSLKARINQLKIIEKNSSIGYDYTFTTNRKSKLATIALGYADGIDRQLSNKMLGSINNQLIKQVGLISMDQMIFDVTDIDDVNIGDIIEIISYKKFDYPFSYPLSLSYWANLLNTNTYELATRLKGRLPKLFTRSDLN